MQSRIAILITAFERPSLLRKSVESVLNNWQSNWVLIIADQSQEEDKLMKKWEVECPNFYYYHLPFNCGLSYARNFLVAKAMGFKCEYCILSADSIEFDESMKRIDEILPLFDGIYKLGRVGFYLKNRINWEGWLDLIPNECFELELIDTTSSGLYRCNCIKNFFIARTLSLLDVEWDEKLKMAEHECHTYRYAQKWETLYSNYYSGNYIGTKDGIYGQYRQQNWMEGIDYLGKKYNLQTWIRYKNPELFDRS